MGGEGYVLDTGALVAVSDRWEVLWFLAFLFYGVGDTATTLLGLRATGIEEAGPVALFAMNVAGEAGFLLLKLGFLATCFAAWWILETKGRIAIPLALIVAGAAVTSWNVLMLLL